MNEHEGDQDQAAFGDRRQELLNLIPPSPLNQQYRQQLYLPQQQYRQQGQQIPSQQQQQYQQHLQQQQKSSLQQQQYLQQQQQYLQQQYLQQLQYPQQRQQILLQQQQQYQQQRQQIPLQQQQQQYQQQQQIPLQQQQHQRTMHEQERDEDQGQTHMQMGGVSGVRRPGGQGLPPQPRVNAPSTAVDKRRQELFNMIPPLLINQLRAAHTKEKKRVVLDIIHNFLKIQTQQNRRQQQQQQQLQEILTVWNGCMIMEELVTLCVGVGVGMGIDTRTPGLETRHPCLKQGLLRSKAMNIIIALLSRYDLYCIRQFRPE